MRNQTSSSKPSPLLDPRLFDPYWRRVRRFCILESDSRVVQVRRRQRRARVSCVRSRTAVAPSGFTLFGIVILRSLRCLYNASSPDQFCQFRCYVLQEMSVLPEHIAKCLRRSSILRYGHPSGRASCKVQGNSTQDLTDVQTSAIRLHERHQGMRSCLIGAENVLHGLALWPSPTVRLQPHCIGCSPLVLAMLSIQVRRSIREWREGGRC